MGAATLWRDVQAEAPGLMPDPQAVLSPWLAVDETWLSIGGAKRPVAMVPGPKGERLDRQPCAVHRQRTVGRHLRGLDEEALTHRDRILLPILRRLARERPPEAGPVLLALWQEHRPQGRVCLHPEVCQLLWHLVTRWHDLVRSQHTPKVPASTHRLEGWLGRFKPRAHLTRGLKTEAGARHFVGLMARGMA